MTEKHYMKWDDVFDRLNARIHGMRVDLDINPHLKATSVYGIPRGGAIVAGLMSRQGFNVVDDPGDADIIVDDIVDSGATMDRYTAKYPGRVFTCLVDKLGQTADSELGWVVFPWEERDETGDIEDTVTRQLEFIGEDPTRQGLIDTPKRYIKALQELTWGLSQDPKEPLAKMFDEKHDEIVCVKDMEFSSLCEHHLLAFTGVVHFAYVPRGKIVGLSKIPRMVNILARRLQVQERLTTQIVDTFDEVLKPVGVMAVVEGQHSCMSCRGVRSQGKMVTSVVRGCFMDKPEARAEALVLMGIR